MNTDLPGSQDPNDMQAMVYKYDQLHRLVQARSLRAYTTSFTHRSASAVTVNAYDANYTYDGNGNLLTLQRRNAAAAIQDNFTYGYYANSNKLRQTASAQGNNYEYDAIGNLTKDVAGGVTNIEWTPSGKVRKVTKSSGSPIEFRYDAAGNRVEKKQGTTITRYIRDASGNVMAVYQNNVLTERPIYGSSRLGQLDSASAPGYRRVGLKRYELSNHLGNVLAVVSDRIRMRTDSTWTQVLSRTDYYPFGLEMTGRTESATYRYGFNGKEKDPSGQWSNQTHYDYGFRIYNPTIGKFLSVDPLAKEFPWNSTYAFAEGSPISNIDLDGLEKLDFRTHMAMGSASGNPAVGLITYQLDWFEDKIFGGTERFIRGGFRYAQNEKTHQEYLERPNQHYPANIEQVNHTLTQLETASEIVKRAADVLEGYTALMSFALGGLETNIAGQFAQRTSYLARSSIVPNLADDAGKGGGTAFRYMTEAELNAIRSGSGKGFLRGGRPGETFFTKDVYKSAAKASQRLGLENTPTLRVEFKILNNPTLLRNGTKVRPLPGLSGGGSEFMTTDPVRIRLINWQPLR